MKQVQTGDEDNEPKKKNETRDRTRNKQNMNSVVFI